MKLVLNATGKHETSVCQAQETMQGVQARENMRPLQCQARENGTCNRCQGRENILSVSINLTAVKLWIYLNLLGTWAYTSDDLTFKADVETSTLAESKEDFSSTGGWNVLEYRGMRH